MLWILRFFCVVGMVMLPMMAAAEEQQDESVVLQLKWKHAFQFAGFYMAQERGFYRNAGLDVVFKEKAPQTNITDAVLSGKATYGVSDSALVLDRMQGKKVVALKAIFQRSPLSLLCLESSGIRRVEDLRGKRVMISPESRQNASIMGMLKSHGLDESEVTIVPMSFNIEDLISGKVDAFAAYVTDQPKVLEERGIAYTLLDPGDYGFSFYGDILFTSEAETREHPDRVRRFVDASMKGWRYAFEHIDETIRVITEQYNSQHLSVDRLRYEAMATKRLSGIESGDFGRLDYSKLVTIANAFAVLGQHGSQAELAHLVYNPGKLILTDTEQEFVRQHSVIKMSCYKFAEPYEFYEDGVCQGYAVDYVRLAAKKIGVQVDFVAFDSLVDVHMNVAERKLDGMPAVFDLLVNRSIMDFTRPVFELDGVIATQNTRFDIQSMADLAGKKLANYENPLLTKMLKQRYPSVEVVEYENSAQALKAVAYGEADAMVSDYQLVSYMVHKYGLSNIKIAAHADLPDFAREMYVGIRNDWPVMRQLFDKAMQTITPEELHRLRERWLVWPAPVDDEPVKLVLSDAERRYLYDKGKLTACVDPNWMPLEKIENGVYIGMGSEYLELFRERIGVEIDVLPTTTWSESVHEAKARHCDMFVFSMDTPERETYMNVTKPLIAPFVVLATRMDALFVAELSSLTDQKIGIVNGYALGDVLKEKYPHINFVFVDSMDEGIEKVISGDIFGYLDAFPVIGYAIQNRYFGEVKIAGRFEDKWELGVALRNDEPELFTIFEKAVATISDEERRQIQNRWVAISHERKFDYSLMWKVVIFFTTVIILMVLANRKLLLHKRELNLKNKELEEQKAKINYIAYHDNLTGLPNRLAFNEVLQHAILMAKRNHTMLAVLFIDLDRFKMVNDTLGHPVGDEMLLTVATRISGILRDTDTLARVGGDEFVVLIETVTNPNGAAFVAEKVIDSLKGTIKIHEYELNTSASIGIALYPDDGDDLHALIKNADSAMYLAKSEGRNSYRFFTKKLSDEVHRRLKIENDLRIALERGEFSLVYQPQYNLETRRVVAAEALLRWNHPEEGWVSPAEFIPIAEETGIIVSLGNWVFAKACREFLSWRAIGLSIERIAINVSSVQFNQLDAVANFRSMIETAGIDAANVELEITERYIMEQTEQNQQRLDALRKIGFKISVDDFGTGYSSMSYLKTLPLDTIKIDKSFIDDLPHDKNDVAISRAILALAKGLDYNVVAEGIEYTEQEVFLKTHLCDMGQGYLFSKPLDSDAFITFMQQA